MPQRRNGAGDFSPVCPMLLLLLEALAALLILVFIVWWTMFSGRKKGELPDDAQSDREGDRGGNAGDPGKS
jgi:hypothetical protein